LLAFDWWLSEANKKPESSPHLLSSSLPTAHPKYLECFNADQKHSSFVSDAHENGKRRKRKQRDRPMRARVKRLRPNLTDGIHTGSAVRESTDDDLLWRIHDQKAIPPSTSKAWFPICPVHDRAMLFRLKIRVYVFQQIGEKLAKREEFSSMTFSAWRLPHSPWGIQQGACSSLPLRAGHEVCPSIAHALSFSSCHVFFPMAYSVLSFFYISVSVSASLTRNSCTVITTNS